MCSRYSLTTPSEAVRAFFGFPQHDDYPARYNIAPTQPVAIVRHNLRHERELALVRWGLIPSWVKDPRTLSLLINARSETARVKPSFRSSMRHRRCLVPADGFYEWTGRTGQKQPHLIRRRDGGILAFAGIWEHWLGADGSELETMAILTTTSNRELRGIHDRCPVMLEPPQFEDWLDTRSGSSVGLEAFMQPSRDGLLEIIPVSARINNPTHDAADVQEPLQGTLL